MSPPDDRQHPTFRGPPRFEVVRLIGAGGIGLVYEAVDHEDSTRVAVKTLQRLDSDGLLRFKNEFRLLQGLHHRNLVRLGELFEHEGQWFFTMELLDGVDFMAHVAPSTHLAGRTLTEPDPSDALSTVTSRLSGITPMWQVLPDGAGERRERPAPAEHDFDEARLREALLQLTAGLMALHGAGKVHRDIKPQNVMVAGERVVLLDFGLVSDASGEAAMELGMILGTPAYMSPEQASGQPTTPASDWYGVGVMLYEALVGSRPFEGSWGEVMMAKQDGEPVPPSLLKSDLPRDLEQLCMDLLRRDADARPTGADVAARLSARAAVTAAVPRAVTEPQRSDRMLQSVPLIGREPLLESLHQAFAQRGHGEPMAVFVHGSSGMGKTALVEHFASTLREHAPAALLLRGRCYERESVPYKAFDGIVDALARYLKRPDVGAEFLVPHRLDTLVRLFPVLQGVRKPVGLPGHAAGTRDPQVLRREAFAALRELFARVAAKWPLVLTIDDLQWGDLDSAALLVELLSPPGAPGMLLIASYRSEESDSALLSSLRENIARAVPQRCVRELQVGPLAEADCRRLAAASLDALTDERDASADALADLVAHESAGNPFFVGEMVRHLVATGAHRGGSRPGSVTLESALASRRERLSSAARAVFDVLAVAGRPIAQGIALAAAALASSQRAVFDELRAEHLVRTRGRGTRDLAECYHDRIREAVLAQLAPPDIERINRQLAAALEDSGAHDPEILAECYLGAGEPERAATHALAAAALAERALAFDRAAHMYRMVLDCRPGTDDEARALRVKLGEALVNASRGGDAAAEFLAAAIGAPDGEAQELERRAAEQLLRSGRIDQGLSLLGEVLAASKLHVPRTDQGALMSLAMHRTRLRLRGLDYQPRPAAEVPARSRARVDICWAGAVGLGMIDPMRGADFGTRCLLMALDSGDEIRIARALAMEAALVAAGGGPSVPRAEALAERASQIARRIDDPHALGLAIFGSAAASFLSGRWRTAHDEARRSELLLRAHCPGLAWEMTTLQLFQLASLFYMGEWSAMDERASTALRQALDRSDLYMVASLVNYATFGRLAADDSEGARLTIRQATMRWSVRGYHIQNYLHLMSHLYTDLYEGKGEAAWSRLQDDWPQMSRSLIRRVQLVRIEITYARARCALARALELAPSRRAAMWRVAGSDARRIERERMPWAMPLAALMRAAVAAGRGQVERAATRLEAAANAFDDAGMHLFAAVARYRLGELSGGDRGGELEAEARATMQRQGIANPERLVAALAPGFVSGGAPAPS